MLRPVIERSFPAGFDCLFAQSYPSAATACDISASLVSDATYFKVPTIANMVADRAIYYHIKT